MFSRRPFILSACVLVLSLFRAEAQELWSYPGLRHYLSALQRGEFYFCVDRPQGHWIDSLTRYASIDRVTPDKLILYADPGGYHRLRELELEPTLLAPPSLREPIKMSEGLFPAAWDRYPTYQEYLDLMHGFTENYPQLCSLDTIGTSKNDRLILALVISGNAVPEFRPSFFYTATMHGDEVAGYVIMLRLADHLLHAYGQDPVITALMDRVRICINPLSNPDGTYALSDTSIAGATRFNSEGIDLNRNFPDPSGDQNPDGRDRAPENAAMMAYMKEQGFQMSCNLHGGAELLNYPWDTWSRLHADHPWFVKICRAYADTVHLLDPDYLTDQNNGITNGYAWYEVDGSRQDYMCYYLRGREVTLEIAEEKIPDAADLPRLWDLNRKSLIQFMEHARYGLSGRVSDSLSGQPLRAEIRHGLDRDRSSVLSDSLTGIYYRYLYGGNYTFTASAPGYREKSLTVNISDKLSQQLDFLLIPGEEPAQNFHISLENPFSRTLLLQINIPQSAEARIRLYDLQGRLCMDLASIALTAGENEINIHSDAWADGMYILSIEIPGTPGIRYRQKIIKVRSP